MPRVLISLPDVEQTITRPMIFDMANQIMEIADIPKDTEVQYAGKRGTNLTPGSSILNQDRQAKFTASNITFVTITEDYNTEAIQEIQPYSWDQQPLFLDQKLGLSIRPVYVEVNVNVEIVFRHTSETEVRKWLSSMYIKSASGRQGNLHSLTYTYPVPYEFTFLMEEIFNLREAVEGYGQTLSEYFDQHRVSRMSRLSNQIGGQQHYVVREKQSNVLGFFEIPTVPDKPEHLDDIGVWEGKLVYKYSYQRPEQVLLDYPITVHNQYLPEKYLKHLEAIEEPKERPHHFSYSYRALENFSLDNDASMGRPVVTYIKLPSFDDFGENHYASQTIFPEPTATIFTALVFPDEDKQTLCDLNDLGDIFIDEDILDFFKTEYPYLTKLYHSVYHVSLFIDGETRPYDEVEITADLHVKATKPLSLRSRYHIRLALLPEVNKPLYGALKRLAAHPKAFYKTVKGINELLAIDPDFRNWERTEQVEDWQFTAIYQILFGFSPGNVFSSGTNLDAYVSEQMATVRNNWHLLTKLKPSQVENYLNSKRLRMKSTMVGFCVAKHIETM